MLMQNFKTAADLGITEHQKEALMKTLVLLETGKLIHVTEFKVLSIHSESYSGHFNIRAWSADSDCGTVRCIGGTAEAVGNVSFDGWADEQNALYDLFSPPYSNDQWNEITQAQAAAALRSYLTTGDARWDLAVS